MATKHVCDRCGGQATKTIRVTEVSVAAKVYLSIAGGKTLAQLDLCPVCVEGLKVWLKGNTA